MRLFVLALFLILSVTAAADCIHNDKSYPTGTILGPLICAPDGTWQPNR